MAGEATAKRLSWNGIPQLAAQQRCLLLNPPPAQGWPLLRQLGHLVVIPLPCPLGAVLSPGAVHWTGWLAVTGRWVLRSVPGTICSLRAREGTCLAFALVKHLAQNIWPELCLC